MERNVWGNKRNIWGADVGEPIQVDELPTASIDELGNIYQYVGTTDANYTNGYFYQCVSDGQTPPTYSWQRKNVQPNSGGVWGSITGTLSNQTDLNTQLTAIKAKTDKVTFLNKDADFYLWYNWRYNTQLKQEVAAAIVSNIDNLILACYRDNYTECVGTVDLNGNWGLCYLVSNIYIMEIRLQKSNDVWTINNITQYQIELNRNRRTTWQATPEDTKYPSEKLVKDSLDQKADIVHIETPATAADYEIGYDKVTDLGTLTGLVGVRLQAIAQGDTAAHVYHIIFTADTTAPTITWPEGITWAGGSAPTITASKTYEISIFHNLAIGKEY